MRNTCLTSVGWFGEAHCLHFSLFAVLIWSFLFNLNQLCILCIGRLLYWISKFKKIRIFTSKGGRTFPLPRLSHAPHSVPVRSLHHFLKGNTQSRHTETALSPEGSCQMPHRCWNPMGYSNRHIESVLSSLDARCKRYKSQITKVP